MDTQRLILFVVLGLTVLMLWDAWIDYQYPQVTQGGSIVNSGSSKADHDNSELPEVPERGSNVPDSVSSTSVGELISFETRDFQGTLSSIGGSIVELAIKDTHVSNGEPLALFSRSSARYYEAQSGLLGNGLPNHRSAYVFLGQETDGNLVTFRFKWAGDGIEVLKVLKMGGEDFIVDVAYEVYNQSAGSLPVSAYFQLVKGEGVAESNNFFMPTYTGGAFYTDFGRYQKAPTGDIMEGTVRVPAPATDGWVAMVQHYYLSSWLLDGDQRREFYARPLRDGRVSVGLMLPEALPLLAPRSSGSFSARLYAGPQAQQVLGSVAEGLELTVDYGWLRVIAAPLYDVLAFIHRHVNNWGVAIILLTVLVKLVFYPLSAYSYKSMAHMRKVAPKLQKLKEQYGDDRQRLHEGMMELYRSEKINPLGGCLPILVQIPVFIALYWVLLYSVELKGAPFFGWIHDLSEPDPWFVLPVIMAVTMYVQMKLNPAPPDPIQAKVMMIMPLVFSIFFLFFPAGLVLYWVVNNILSILQQWRINVVVERSTSHVT